MEAKKFVSTIKGYRTRFTNKPNAELEKKQIEGTVENFGGKITAFTELKKADAELLAYVKGVLGMVKVAPVENAEKPVEKAAPKKSSKKQAPVEADSDEETLASSTSGSLYEIDTVKKTCKRIFKDLKQIDIDAIEVTEMPMTTYHRYLLDTFPGEGAKLNKKGQLTFRGYRIQCTIENGFTIEDIKTRALVATPFEGIPTPRELGDFFKRPVVEHTPEELQEAVKRGKELMEKSEKEHKEEAPIDFELLRKKVIGKIIAIRNKKVADFDPETFPEMIPFRRWKINARMLLNKWKERKMRYPKFLDELEKLTREETFETKKQKAPKFVGTLLPEYTSVGELKGDTIIVDGKSVPASPFIRDVLLHFEPAVMPQLMRYATGAIDRIQLLTSPIEKHPEIEYNSKVCEHVSAVLLTLLCTSVGIVPPQDLLYDSGLEVDDRVLFHDGDEWVVKKVTEISDAVYLGKDFALLKTDKWLKLEEGEKSKKQKK